MTTKSLTPASRQARTIAMPSSNFVAIGFSHSTWRPARAHVIACRGCNPLGVASTTMSAPLPASSASIDPNPGTPVACVARASAEGFGVAHRDEFRALAVFLECCEMAARDAAATDEREAQASLCRRHRRHTVTPAASSAAFGRMPLTSATTGRSPRKTGRNAGACSTR